MKPHHYLAAVLAISACGTTYKQTSIQAKDTALDEARTVLISVPADGSYGGRAYAGSGRMTADAVRSAFLRVGPRADIAGACELPDCLDRARSEGFGYLVEPTILHWEDRATEWSGISDKVEVRLSIYDVETGQQVGSQVIAGSSSFWTFGGDHPQDLLPEPVTAYIRGLYS